MSVLVARFAGAGGLGPIPALGTVGSAIGTSPASWLVSDYSLTWTSVGLMGAAAAVAVITPQELARSTPSPADEVEEWLRSDEIDPAK